MPEVVPHDMHRLVGLDPFRNRRLLPRTCSGVKVSGNEHFYLKTRIRHSCHLKKLVYADLQIQHWQVSPEHGMDLWHSGAQVFVGKVLDAANVKEIVLAPQRAQLWICHPS